MNDPNLKKRDRNSILEMIYAFYENKGNAFFTAIEQFDSFYSRSDYSLKIGTQNYRPSGDFALMIISNEVTNETDFARFKYRFEEFNHEGMEVFDYESTLTFRFGETKWSFETSDKNESIQRSYSEELTEQDLQKFISYEVKKHSAFIQQKINAAKSNYS